MINCKGREVLGYTQENEVVGRSWFDCVPADVRDETRSVFEKIVTGGKPERIRRVLDGPPAKRFA